MALKQLALVACIALSVAACEEDRYRGSARHNIPIPSATYTLMAEKGMSKDQPILIRSYKKESELEIWKRKPNGQYALLKSFRCAAGPASSARRFARATAWRLKDSTLSRRRR